VLGGLTGNGAFLAFVAETYDDVPCAENEGEDERLLCRIPRPARDVVASMLQVEAERRSDLDMILGSDWLRQAAIATV
jgi:hypothetical protein